MHTLTHTHRSFDSIKAAVDQIDLGAIAYRLEHKEGWSLERIGEALVGYRQFLTLSTAYSGERFAPSRDIDEVWHAHLLDTRKYASDCARSLGAFLHHFPFFGMRSAQDRDDLIQAHERTQALAAQHFGPASRIGGEGDPAKAAHCNPGCCGGAGCDGELTAIRPKAGDAYFELPN